MPGDLARITGDFLFYFFFILIFCYSIERKKRGALLGNI